MKTFSAFILKFAFLSLVSVSILKCSSEKTHHDYLIGHWKQTGNRSTTENPNLVDANPDSKISEIYFSKKIMWYVGEDNTPKKLTYVITEDNTADSLLKIQTNYNKEITNIDIKFSSGYNEIKVIQRQYPTFPPGLPEEMKNIIMRQVGIITITNTYTRVDKRKSPF